tara:strand:+ start:43 stop:573 length:531 start_codon:yes stop_codon:yes gene_type:complete
MPIAQFTAGQVLTAAELNLMVDAINAGGSVKVAAFTSSGTFTPPTGVTYAVAYIRAGGGGVGTSAAGTGGTSSVAFASGTISALGGGAYSTGSSNGLLAIAGQANSGHGALMINDILGATPKTSISGGATNGALITAGGAVTAGVGITVTVGAGGTAGSSGQAGGSGYIYIEYSGG